MKKINLIFLVATLIGILILTGCSDTDKSEVVLKSQNVENTDNSWDMVIESGVLKVGVKSESLPYVEKISDNEYKGFMIDVVNEIGKIANIDINYVDIADKSVATLLADNTIDVILNGYTLADTGNMNIRWLKSYMTNHHIILCSSNSGINTKEDLSDKITGVAEDTVSDINAQSDIKIDNNSLKKYETEKKALLALANNNIDALIIDDAYYYYYERYHNHDYKVLDEIVSLHVRSLGVNKDKIQLGKHLESILNEMKENRTLEKLSLKWFNKNLTE